jgi:hypothetical protein
MAIHEIEPLAEPEVPTVTMLRDMTEGHPTVYHFKVNDQESSITLRRRELEEEPSYYSYDFLFFGWEFATADVKSWRELTVIEEQSIAEGLDELGQFQAKRLMRESAPFLIMALDTDFPEAYAIEDANGNIL